MFAMSCQTAFVTAVSRDGKHAFSKPIRDSIRLIAGVGIEGDVHAGRTVQHRSRIARDPAAPDLRQVHLIHAELHDELNLLGYRVSPGDMGENVTTRGIDLLGLPTGTRLKLGPQAVVEVTGLRNPCVQLDGFRPGLMKAVLDRDAVGGLVRKAGVMAIVLSGGVIRPGDAINVAYPAGRRTQLKPV
jgi:MOSC domain-containing protein YiiM